MIVLLFKEWRGGNRECPAWVVFCIIQLLSYAVDKFTWRSSVVGLLDGAFTGPSLPGVRCR